MKVKAMRPGIYANAAKDRGEIFDVTPAQFAVDWMYPVTEPEPVKETPKPRARIPRNVLAGKVLRHLTRLLTKETI